MVTRKRVDVRVLNVIDGTGWTGGVEQTMLLADEMRKAGLDASVACHEGNPVLDEALQRKIPARSYDRGGGRRQRFGALRRMLQEGYDVVIGHKPAAIRHLILPVYTLVRRPLFIGVRRVSFPVSPLTVYRAVDHVVAVSRNVRSVLAGSGLGGAKITVIPSGVETERFRFDKSLRRRARKELGLEGKRVILNLAKFVPAQKGQGILFRALAELKGMEDIRLVLAGLETDGADARQMVRTHGLEEHVALLGFRRDIPRLLCAADLFVFPSLPGLDAIAGSVLQAMACERIVISSRVGGIPEYVASGRNGFLVEPGDVQSLTGMIATALAMDERAQADMGARARQSVTAGYSTVAMARSYGRLLEGLLTP